MPRNPVALKAAHTLFLLSIATAMHGCGSSRPLSGRHILDELERSRVAVPDEAGRVPQSNETRALPETGPIALADLLRVAEATSPDLAAARRGVGIAAGRAWQASLYPNPRVDISSEDLAWRNGTSDAKTTVGFTQPIILGDRREAAIKSASAEQSSRLAEVEAKRRVLFGDIAVLYARLISVRDQERLYGELHDLVAKTLSSAQTRFEAKAAPETDMIRPRVELYRVEAALGRLKQERLSTAKELGLLVGNVSIDPARLDGSVSLSPEGLDVPHLESAVRNSHPSLAAADRRIESASAKMDQIKAEKTPDLDVRVGVGYNGEIQSGVVDVGVGMTVPLWDTREGDTLSARFELMQARQERAGVENELLRRLTNAIGEFESAKAQLDTFRDKIVPDAQRSFEQTSEGYRAGRASFLDLLDAQRTFTEARVTLTELASATATARAKVVQIVGPDGFNSPSGPSSQPAHELSSPNPVRPQGEEVKP